MSEKGDKRQNLPRRGLNVSCNTAPTSVKSGLETANGPLDVAGASLARILNSLDALVYVADMETRQLLFINEYGRKVWGEPAGRRCWEVLQSGQSGPCAFCNNADLIDAAGNPTGVQVWEFLNTSDGRWYQCRDQAIRWDDGRLVRLEIATDISERKQLEQELEAARARAEALAWTDELTGLDNRRAFFHLGRQACRQSARSQRAVSVIMLDIDHFKEINDTYGHSAGDRVLQKVAETLRPLVRDADVLARIGGEEFALLLPETEIAAAEAVAERLRQALESVVIEWEGSALRCTASLGVACCLAGDASLDTLLTEADHALYAAKQQGRNRVRHGVVPNGDPSRRASPV